MRLFTTSVKAVIFDYDGTLVHLNIDFGAMRHEVERFLVQYGLAPDAFEGLYILEMIHEATKLLRETNPSGARDFKRDALKTVMDHELKAAQEGEILPGVMDLLELLEVRGVKVGVITRNCDKAVKMTFPHIERYCDVFIPRDNVGRVKPHPDHLALALRRLGVKEPPSSLMVGDHVLDIQAGKRMQMKTAGVLTGRTTHRHFVDAGADLILPDVTKIAEHIFQEQKP